MRKRLMAALYRMERVPDKRTERVAGYSRCFGVKVHGAYRRGR